MSQYSIMSTDISEDAQMFRKQEQSVTCSEVKCLAHQTRNVLNVQLKTDVRTYNSHIEDKFYHDGDAKDGDGNDDKNVEFDEYE